ncbi:MAG: dihydroorotase [Treponemataceae bacterium]|nr:MAG: dihydroorotase [Treponemataceae bacterium]
MTQCNTKLIFNARLVDAERSVFGAVLTAGGVIAEVFEGNFTTAASCTKILEKCGIPQGRHGNIERIEYIDGRGLTLEPAFIDMHAHFRYPGAGDDETLESGLAAATAGGYTALVLMPNTKPPISDMLTVQRIEQEAANISASMKKNAGFARVIQSMTITKNFSGTDTSHLDDSDCMSDITLSPLVTEDGRDVANPDVLLDAMKKCAKKNIIVACHCEDALLAERAKAHRLAFLQSAQDAELTRANEFLAQAEDVATKRNLELAENAQCRVHICHVSTKNAISAVKETKKRGTTQVTCEITPHHLALCVDSETSVSANATAAAENLRRIVNPPLRFLRDIDALHAALADGTADVISTDHAPHTLAAKNAGAPGFPGLETAFAVCNTVLVKGGILSENALSQKMSLNPARILALEKCPNADGKCAPQHGLIKKGWNAKFVLLDPNETWTVHSKNFFTKGALSPFDNMTLTGRVTAVI